MNDAVNYYELKTELAGLGFTETALLKEVEEACVEQYEYSNITTTAHQCFYDIDFQRDDQGRIVLTGYSAGNNNSVYQSFAADVPAQLAARFLPHAERAEQFIPLNKQQIQQIMNEKNQEFLNDSLTYLGFDERLKEPLEKMILEGKKEFTLEDKVEHYGQKTMDYTLHFKKGDQDVYFFNKFDAKLTDGYDNTEKSQTIHLHKGHGFTAKESFNMLEGRAVYKQLSDKKGQKYHAWNTLDMAGKKTAGGNHHIIQYGAAHNYDMEKSLGRFDIKEMGNDEDKAKLLKSLEKGNRQQLTITADGKETKLFVEANPQYRSVNLYDDKFKAVKHVNFLKPEAKKQPEQKQEQEQSKKRGQRQAA